MISFYAFISDRLHLRYPSSTVLVITALAQTQLAFAFDMDVFTLDDVAKRSTETSGYIVIDRKVYEITNYMSKHP